MRRRSSAPPRRGRTTVTPVAAQDVRDPETHRALRLIRTLRALFGDSVIDIDRTPTTEEEPDART